MLSERLQTDSDDDDNDDDEDDEVLQSMQHENVELFPIMTMTMMMTTARRGMGFLLCSIIHADESVVACMHLIIKIWSSFSQFGSSAPKAFMCMKGICFAFAA